MKNANTIARVALLHPDNKDRFTAFVEELEGSFSDFDSILVDQGLRTFAEQDALYAIGRTRPGHRVTAAQAGQSWHCYGLAIDIVPMLNGACQWNYDYSKFSVIALKHGLTWGRPWKDEDHYEFNCGQGPSGWRWALAKYNAGDFIPGTQYINLQS